MAPALAPSCYLTQRFDPGTKREKTSTVPPPHLTPLPSSFLVPPPLFQRRDNPRRSSVILPALADVHAAPAAPRRAGGGGKRARLGGAPALASILEGVPSLAEDDDAGKMQQQRRQAVEVASADASPDPPSSTKTIVSPEGTVEEWSVQQQHVVAVQ